ncbi:hypothetical protein BV898_12706 [Hypsibius exemplaris]|uniref:Uncharacterized protein n=1 Tax=Hypsibius exemplaris TaxID=2072580 RepID=A0A1W0WCX7_HYPEX|nr:hypothetical protein BV898_12706 [Hypsibius exemplaris]
MDMDIKLTPSLSKKKVEFAVPVDSPQPNPSTLEVPAKSAKKKQAESEHKHELVVLSHLVKRRLRTLIRRLQSKTYSLHLKRQYKRNARERKVQRRVELDRKKKAAEKAALKKLEKGAKSGKKGEKDSGKKSPQKPTNGQEGPPKKVAKKQEGSLKKVVKGQEGSPKKVANRQEGSPKKPAKGQEGSPNKVANGQEGPLKKVAKEQEGSPKKVAKGQEGSPKKTEDRLKPGRRRQKWRKNRYRKWRQVKLRAKFTRQERAHRLFDIRHPGTRPFIRENFGWSKSEELVRRIHRQRVSARWSETMAPSGDPYKWRPVPTVNPYMGRIAKPLGRDEAKRRLARLVTDEWELANYDAARSGQLVKAMAALIVAAKERYDDEENLQKEVPQNLGDSSPNADVETEELQGEMKEDLQRNLKRLMKQTPSDRLATVERHLLAEILRDKQVRRNTFINRPKTTYDSYLRRELTTQTQQKYLQQYHLLRSSACALESRTSPRKPLPYRRFIVANLRRPKISLPGTRLRAATSRLGPQPTQPLASILPPDHPRMRVKKIGRKRSNYPRQRDPHNPKPPKKLKKTKDGKSGTAAAAAGKKGKSPAGRSDPPKDTKDDKVWRRKQKEQRRKRKLRKWIVMPEKRRRIKITQEILMEEQFKGKRDLPAMRKKIRALEQQASKATDLVEYLANRNIYLKNQYKDTYMRKHSEYYAVYLNWREECDNWFKLRDDIDKTNEEMAQKAAAFVIRCRAVVDETGELEDRLNKELENLEINHTEIIQFVQHEPIWQEEVDTLLCKPLYYEYLYAFREAREEGNLLLISDLLQRRMHKDFMSMAYQERRKMRRQLPTACKNMFDERGLLAQEMNKISMWCNRLSRRQERLILPEIEERHKEQNVLRHRIHDQVVRRQPITLQTRALKWTLRGCNLRLNRKETSYQKMEVGLQRARRKLERTEYHLEVEIHNNEQKRAVVEALKSHIGNLQGMVTRDYQQRLVNSQVLGEIARALKQAFGVPSDFNRMHWPARGAAQNCGDDEPNGMVSHLKRILDIAKASSAKAVLAPANFDFVGRHNLLRNVPASLQRFSA